MTKLIYIYVLELRMFSLEEMLILRVLLVVTE